MEVGSDEGNCSRSICCLMILFNSTTVLLCYCTNLSMIRLHLYSITPCIRLHLYSIALMKAVECKSTNDTISDAEEDLGPWTLHSNAVMLMKCRNSEVLVFTKSCWLISLFQQFDQIMRLCFTRTLLQNTQGSFHHSLNPISSLSIVPNHNLGSNSLNVQFLPSLVHIPQESQEPSRNSNRTYVLLALALR